MTNTIAPILTSKTTVSTLTHIKKATSTRLTIPLHSMKAPSITGKTKPTTRQCYILKRQIRSDPILTNTQTSHTLCPRRVLLRILPP